MPWAFLGHADDDWTLTPTAWRAANSTMLAARRDAVDRLSRYNGQHNLNWIYPPTNLVCGPITFNSATDDQLSRQLVAESTAELLLLYDFANACDSDGISEMGQSSRLRHTSVTAVPHIATTEFEVEFLDLSWPM